MTDVINDVNETHRPGIQNQQLPPGGGVNKELLFAGIQGNGFTLHREVSVQLSHRLDGEVFQTYLEDNFREIKTEVSVLPILGNCYGKW